MNTVLERFVEKQRKDFEKKKSVYERGKNIFDNDIILEAKALTFSQFVADYYDAKDGADKVALKRARKTCRELYDSLESRIDSINPRIKYKYKHIAVAQTDAYLRERYTGNSDLKHRSRLAKFLKAITGNKWLRVAYRYRFGSYYNSMNVPLEAEVMGWPGLVGFPDLK